MTITAPSLLPHNTSLAHTNNNTIGNNKWTSFLGLGFTTPQKKKVKITEPLVTSSSMAGNQPLVRTVDIAVTALVEVNHSVSPKLPALSRSRTDNCVYPITDNAIQHQHETEISAVQVNLGTPALSPASVNTTIQFSHLEIPPKSPVDNRPTALVKSCSVIHDQPDSPATILYRVGQPELALSPMKAVLSNAVSLHDAVKALPSAVMDELQSIPPLKAVLDVLQPALEIQPLIAVYANLQEVLSLTEDLLCASEIERSSKTLLAPSASTAEQHELLQPQEPSLRVNNCEFIQPAAAKSDIVQSVKVALPVLVIQPIEVLTIPVLPSIESALLQLPSLRNFIGPSTIADGSELPPSAVPQAGGILNFKYTSAIIPQSSKDSVASSPPPRLNTGTYYVTEDILRTAVQPSCQSSAPSFANK